MLRDVLKPDGSIYFHCDPVASHYIKVIMDGLMGRNNFQNEVIWKRTSAHSSANKFGPIHDVILFYSMGAKYTWNPVFQPYDEDYIKKNYRHRGPLGRYRPSDLTGAGTSSGESGQPWRGYNPTVRGRHWAIPRKVFSNLPESVIAALEELNNMGRIEWPKNPRDKGPGQPQFKRYLHEMQGQKVQDIILDVNPLSKQERRGFATEKPIPLLERIIKASSNKGDLVLDPFCGCGTTVEAAHSLNRRWIGIDISGNAIDEIKDRMAHLGVYNEQHYKTLEGSPDTMAEYNRLNPFEKQEWLIRRLGGLPNPKKSGDLGKDGDMTFHMGIDKDGNDIWGRMIFSVKTGGQRSPAHVRELLGTMKSEKAQMGVLVIDAEPTAGMEAAAAKGSQFEYQSIERLPPKSYDRVQIVTSYEVIDGARIDCPPSIQIVKQYRKAQMEMKL